MSDIYSDLQDAIDNYWDLAWKEGNRGARFDELGKAQECRSGIESKILKLRQQLAQAQGDVARLREAIESALSKRYCGPATEILKDAINGSSDAFIKLKQAEALAAVSLKIAIMCETDPQEVVEAEAQRLRGEVDQ